MPHRNSCLWRLLFVVVLSVECAGLRDGIPFVMQTREELERALHADGSIAMLFLGRGPGCSECGKFERSYAAVRGALSERVSFTKFYLDATPELAISLGYQDRPLLVFFGGPAKLVVYQGGSSPRSIAAFILEQTRPEHDVEEFRTDPDEPSVDVALRKISYDAALLEGELALLDDMFGALLNPVDSVQKFSELARKSNSTLIGITNEKEGVFSSYLRDFSFLHPELGITFALCIEDERHICTKSLRIPFPRAVLQQPEDHTLEREAVDDENTAPLRYDDEYSFFVLQLGQDKFRQSILSSSASNVQFESSNSLSFPPQFLYDYIPVTEIPEETVGVTPFNFERLLEFLYEKDTVLVNRASDYTFTSFSDKDFVLLLTSKDGFNSNTEKFGLLAKEHSDIKFFYSSDNELMNQYGIHSLPALLIHSSSRKENYVLMDNFTIANGNQFIASFKNHTLSPFIKSESHSNNTGKDVSKVNGNEFTDFVNQEKNVFVLVYLELQTRFAKMFEESVKRSRSNGALYGMMDKSKNDLPYWIEKHLFEYPALLLFPQGRKSDPILFKGTFSEKAMETFFRDYRLKRHSWLSENVNTKHQPQPISMRTFSHFLKKQSKVKTVAINSPQRLTAAITNYRERVPVVIDFFIDLTQSYEKMIEKLPSSLQGKMMFISYDCSDSTKNEKIIKKYVNGFPSLTVVYRDRILHFDGLQTRESLRLFLQNAKASLPPIKKMVGKSKEEIVNDFTNELQSDKLFIYLLTTFNSIIFRLFFICYFLFILNNSLCIIFVYNCFNKI